MLHSYDIPNKLEYKTVLHHKVLLGLKTLFCFFFFSISVRISILLSKTVSYRSGTGIESGIESGARVFNFGPRMYTTSYYLNSSLACFERINLRHSGCTRHSK